MRRLYIIGIILLAWHVGHSQYVMLDDTVDVFSFKVLSLLEKTGNAEADSVGQDFNALWSSSFSDSQKSKIIATALKMQSMNLSRGRYFRDYFAVLNASVQLASISATKLDHLLEMLSQSLEMQSPSFFGRELDVLKAFFRTESLHYSRNNRLLVFNSDYDFEFIPPADAPPDVYMPDLKEYEPEKEDETLDWDIPDDKQQESEKDPWAEDSWSDTGKEDDGWSDGWGNTDKDGSASQTSEAVVPDIFRMEGVVEQVEEQGAIIRFNKVDLVFATRYDSAVLESTSGVFLMDRYLFSGKGGRMDWSSAGLNNKDAFVEMDIYNFNTRLPYIQAQQARLTNKQYLDKQITGIFEFRSVKHDSVSNALYPRFTSYENNHQVKGLPNKNLTFTGGFAMRGGHVQGAALFTGRSTLALADTEGRRFKVRAQHFDFMDSLVQARDAEITIYHRRDSISHPSVKFRYYYGANKMVAIKELGGFKVRPFNSSYYNMTIEADIINWDIDLDSMDISILNARTMLPAVFRSSEFYDEKDITDLTGVYNFNPLLMVYNFGRTIKSREIYVDDIVQKTRLNEKAVRSSMQELAYLDYIEYENVSGRIYLKDKALHYVRSKNNNKDYDDLMINSLTHNGPNATLAVSSNEMTVRGIEKFYISEMLDVYIYPIENSITLLRNRDFKFDGQLFAGNFEFAGRDFTFRYDSFLVELTQIDSIKFYVDRGDNQKVQVENKMVSARDNEGENFHDFSFLSGGTSGILYINRPDNKSGRKFFPQYPVFDANKGAVVYFNDPNTLDGAYDQSVYFVVPPFGIDSLSSSDPAAIGFKGTFISGGIMPDFDETLRIMEDNSLGLSHVIPEEGYQLYGGKGKIYNEIKLDQNGLVGKGTIDYLSGSSQSDEITYYLDSAIAENTRFNVRKGDHSGVSYPDIEIDSAGMKWFPQEDLMVVSNKSDLFDLYGSTASLDGTINLTPQGAQGTGTMMTRGFTSVSEQFNFQEKNLQARHAFFDLQSDNPDKPLLTGDDIRLDFDFTNNIADLSPEIEGMAAIDFPYAQVKTSISKATWNLDEGKVYMTKPPEVDIENSYFYATRKELDSLAFNAEEAVYDLKSSELKVSGIPFIIVADAYVIPENNEVLILENATIGELSNTTIIIDTLNEYHRLIDGTINILSRTEFTGKATYEFVNAVNDTFNIDFRRFELWKDPIDRRAELQTVSSGAVTEEYGLQISKSMYYKGDMKMYARNKALELDGYIKLDLKSKPDYNTWIKYRSQDEYTQEVMFPFEQAVTERGNYLSAGIHHQSLSKDLYFTFAEDKKLEADEDFFKAAGILSFDQERDLFTIEDTAKVNGSKYSGKIFTYNDATGDITFEGPVSFMEPDDHVQITGSGLGNGNAKSNDLSVDVLAKFDYDIPEQALTIMAADVFEVAENFGFAEAESDPEAFLFKVSEIIGDRGAVEYDKRSREDYIPIASFTSKMIGGLVFSKLKLKWSPEYNSWYSTDKLGLSNILRYDINSQIDGFLEIRKTEEKGDIVNIFIQVSSACWYFFSYEDRRLVIYSSNREFNDYIESKSNINKAAFGEYVFVQGDRQDALDYIDRFRSEYLGIKQPYEINVPGVAAQETIDLFADPEVTKSSEDGFGNTEDLGFGPGEGAVQKQEKDLGFGSGDTPAAPPANQNTDFGFGPTDDPPVNTDQKTRNGSEAATGPAPEESNKSFGQPVDEPGPENQNTGDGFTPANSVPAEKPDIRSGASNEETPQKKIEDLGFGTQEEKPTANDPTPVQPKKDEPGGQDPGPTIEQKTNSVTGSQGSTTAPQEDKTNNAKSKEDLGFGTSEQTSPVQENKKVDNIEEDLGFGGVETKPITPARENSTAGESQEKESIKDKNKKEQTDKKGNKKSKKDDDGF